MTLRIGVVGLGMMGRRHALAALALADVELVGAVDHSRTDPTFPVVRDLDELLGLGVDACVVATPSTDHVTSALQLAAAGVHALLEKPLALDPAGCEQIAAAFAASGALARVGHVERFNPAVRQLRARLFAGEVGPVRHVSTRRENGLPHRHDGGGPLLDLGTHDFDLTAWLTGQTYESVSVDSLTVSATLSGGITARHVVSANSATRVRTIEVRGDSGVLSADLIPDAAAPDAVTSQLAAFRDLLLERGGSSDLATPDDGTLAVRVACGALGRP